MENNGNTVLLGYSLICLSFRFELSIGLLFSDIYCIYDCNSASADMKKKYQNPFPSPCFRRQFGPWIPSAILFSSSLLDPRNQQQQTQHLTTILSFSELWDPNLPCYPTSNTYMYHCGTLEELDVTDTEIDDQGFISNLTFTLRCAYLQCMTFASWFM